MKIGDVNINEIASDRLALEDFDDIKETIAALVEPGQSAGSSEDFDKIRFLTEQESGDVIDRESISKCDFYSLEFSLFARLGLAEGELGEDASGWGSVDYDRSYESMRLLVEVMFGICAVYIKDYTLGYIKPFGDCIYDFNEGSGLMMIEPEEFLRELIIPRLELDILEGKIDIAKELYDYYHRIPGGNNPYAERLMHKDDFMSVQDAAKALGVTEGRVKKLISEHTLDGYKVGDERALWLSRGQVQRRIDYIAEHGKPTRGKARK